MDSCTQNSLFVWLYKWNPVVFLWCFNISIIHLGPSILSQMARLYSFFYDWGYFILSIYIYHIFFAHLFIDGHLGCFYILAIVNNAVTDIGVHIYFWINILVFFGKIPRRGITTSYGISTFSFSRNLHAVFSSGCTNLHSHWHCKRDCRFLPYPHQHLLFLVFLITVILTGVKWYLIVVLICIFLLISNTEHFFVCGPVGYLYVLFGKLSVCSSFIY